MITGSGGATNATNNQMEMMAALKGLQALLDRGLEGTDVVIVSDSQYVIHGGSKWIVDWKRRNWRNARGKVIKNWKLWRKLDKTAAKFKTRWKWVRGHNGHPMNEACDKAARAAAFRVEALTDALK